MKRSRRRGGSPGLRGGLRSWSRSSRHQSARRERDADVLGALPRRLDGHRADWPRGTVCIFLQGKVLTASDQIDLLSAAPTHAVHFRKVNDQAPRAQLARYALLRVRRILSPGVELPERIVLSFKGVGMVDNAAEKRLDESMPGLLLDGSEPRPGGG